MDYPASTLDAEVFPNFAEIGIHDLGDGSIRQFTSEPGLGESFDDLRRLWQAEWDNRLWIGFNSLSYDNHILAAILDGRDDPATLYKLSCDRISDSEDWLNRRDSIQGEISVDLLALHGGKNAKLGSLKEIGIKLGYAVLQELPYPFDAELTREQMVEVMTYNLHDLRITALAAEASREQIEQRIALSIEMGVRVINKHDAGVAETIMAHVLFGNQKREYPTATSWHLSGRELVKPFNYRHPAFQALRERISQWEMNMRIVVETEENT